MASTQQSTAVAKTGTPVAKAAVCKVSSLASILVIVELGRSNNQHFTWLLVLIWLFLQYTGK